MTIDLNNITNFFNPNRLIWQDAPKYGSSNADVDTDNDAGTDAGSDADSDADFDTDKNRESTNKNESTDDFTQVMRIMEQAEYECNKAKENSICSLKDMKENVWDVKEVNRLRKFIDELYDKFLVKGEGAEKMKYTSDRLKRLEQELNMEAIIKEFLNSKSYKIVTYTDSQTDKNPKLSDHILFEYKDGTKKKFPLEMSLNPPAIISTGGQNEEVDKEATVGDKLSEYSKTIQEYLRIAEEGLEEMKTEGEIRNTIERSKNLNTPELAYTEMERIAPNLPEDLRNKLSGPLSEYADIISGYDPYMSEMDVSEDDMHRGMDIEERFQKILIDHFGDNYRENMTSEQREELGKIAKTFGLD